MSSESDSPSPLPSAPVRARARAKALRLHEFTLRGGPRKTMPERARTAMVLVRKLCFRLKLAGLNHPEIAEEIDVSLRALLSYKAGVRVPHVVVDALESLVLKVERKVGP